MPIPEKITAKHVRQALRQIDEEGVPARRQATKYYLLHERRTYPRKYVISVAAEYALGHPLDPGEFYGGAEANNFLIERGFTIVDEQGRPLSDSQSRNEPRRAPPRGEAAKQHVLAPSQASPAAAGELPIARLAFRRSWDQTIDSAGKHLLHAFTKRWPRGSSAWITITPGGLLFTRHEDRWAGSCGWASTWDDFQAATYRAAPLVERLLTSPLLRAARERTRWLTIGVDMAWGPDDGWPVPHAELVALVDVTRGCIAGWTGKSYPTASQEGKLVQAPLESHFVTLDRRRIVILGCHDLNMYNPRGNANQRSGGPRRRCCVTFQQMCTAFRPAFVVQHPHSTDSPNIWRTAWSALQGTLPSLKYWASGIAYWEDRDEPRGELDDVLRSTRSPEGVLDLLVDGP